MNNKIKDFFKNSDFLDVFVLRPLWQIKGNWEIMWDTDMEKYQNEEDSFAEDLNYLINELSSTKKTLGYHDAEDRLVLFTSHKSGLSPKKLNGRWVVDDYRQTLEQGGFNDIDEANLLQSAIGRIEAALDRNQNNFDSMEKSHMHMLAHILTTILFHRSFSN